MVRVRRYLLLTLVVLSLFSSATGQKPEPLVPLELSAQALAQHLGVKSWAFAYAYEGDTFQVGLLYYERTRAGTFESYYLTSFSAASDPSGRQRITFLIGPDGENVPYSLGINDGVLSGAVHNADIPGFDLDSFNASAPTTPNAPLSPTGKTGTFILLSRYPAKGGNVTVTENRRDMDAYLALEVGQTQP